MFRPDLLIFMMVFFLWPSRQQSSASTNDNKTNHVILKTSSVPRSMVTNEENSYLAFSTISPILSSTYENVPKSVLRITNKSSATITTPVTVISSSLESHSGHSETPPIQESLKVNTNQQLDLATFSISPTRKVNSPMISPTPVLNPEEEAQVSSLREEELPPQSSPAPDLQPSRSYSSYTEVSLIVPSTTANSFEESTSFGFHSTAMGSTTSVVFPDRSSAIYNPFISGRPSKRRRAMSTVAEGKRTSSDISVLATTQTTTSIEQIQKTLKCTLPISSCHGHCGEIFDSCSCDVNCGVYNVCCDDFEYVCPDISEDAKKSLGGLLDVKIECVGEYTSYLVIAGCPEDYTNSSRRRECEDGKVLINSVGGLQFKNLACLRCHGFTESEKWTKSVFVNYGRDNPFLFFAGIDANRLRAMSISIWKVPNRFNNVSRVCLRDIIDECPKETDSYLSEKCSTSNANVYINSGNATNVYKNVYCAYCNARSVLFCRGTSAYDYKKIVKVGRFSSMISMMFEKESEKFILEVGRPFAWSKAVCTGAVNDLNCIITKCLLGIPPENNTCGLRMSETCVWVEFSTSVNVSKDDLLYFSSVMTNFSIHRPDMEIEKSLYSVDFLNHLLTLRLIFRLWTGPFPYTLDDLYDSYSVIAGNFLTGLELEGEFSLCFNMIREMNTCSRLKCEIRNYTIQDRSNENLASNGGKTPFITSRDTYRISFYSSFALAIAITCLSSVN